MINDRSFDALSREERVALCREVMENLSDLAEGTAPEEFCEQVERLLGDCQPYRAYRDTLTATIRLLAECGQTGAKLSPTREREFAAGVEKARRALRQEEDKAEGP
jgi:hypothetical protein